MKILKIQDRYSTGDAGIEGIAKNNTNNEVYRNEKVPQL